jgi:hypothetical protein
MSAYTYMIGDVCVGDASMLGDYPDVTISTMTLLARFELPLLVGKARAAARRLSERFNVSFGMLDAVHDRVLTHMFDRDRLETFNISVAGELESLLTVIAMPMYSYTCYSGKTVLQYQVIIEGPYKCLTRAATAFVNDLRDLLFERWMDYYVFGKNVQHVKVRTRAIFAMVHDRLIAIPKVTMDVDEEDEVDEEEEEEEEVEEEAEYPVHEAALRKRYNAVHALQLRYDVYVPEEDEVYVPEEDEVYVPEEDEVYVPEEDEVYVPEEDEVYVPEEDEVPEDYEDYTVQPVMQPTYESNRGYQMDQVSAVPTDGITMSV